MAKKITSFSAPGTFGDVNMHAQAMTRRILLKTGACALVVPLSWTAKAQSHVSAAVRRFSLVPPAHLEALDLRIAREGVRHWLRLADEGSKRLPRAVARVHTEHGYKGKPDYDAGVLAKLDWPLFETLAIAWRGTRDDRYLSAYNTYLDAWMAQYRISGNPIDEEGFDHLIISLDLMRERLSPERIAASDRFLTRMSDTYLTFLETTVGDKRPSTTNNWSSHRAKLVVLSSFALGHEARIDRARKVFRVQVARNIRADGHTFDFEERDAIHYHLYSTLPLSMAVAAARAHGEDWFDDRGGDSGSVRDAIDWMLPYIEGTKTHQEFVHTKVAFDRERAARGIAGFKGPFDPAKAIDLMRFACHFDNFYRPVMDRLLARTDKTGSRGLKMLLPEAA